MSGGKQARGHVIVVGGGLSGLAVAQRLAADGVRVDVIEAGQQAIGDHMNAVYSVAEIENMWRVPGEDPTLWRPWDSATLPHYDGATGLRRQLGGRSLYWHGVVLRMDPWALAGASWPNGLAHGGQQLYEQVERELANWCGHGLQAPRSATEDSLLDWLRAAGYPRAERAPLAVQHFQSPRGPRWRAYSPLYAGTANTPAARDQREVAIVTGQRVLAVHQDSRRPLAVVEDGTSGQPRTLTADAIVLAGGTIENTRLVAQMFPRTGDSLVSCPGLNDHILQGFVVYVRRAPWGSQGGEGSCLVIRGDEESRSNMFVKLLDGPEPGSVLLNAWEMGEQERSDRNAVEFDSAQPPPWRPLVRVGLTSGDEQVVAGQQTRLQGAWDRIARALRFPPGTLDFGDFMRAPSDVTGFLDNAVAAPGTAVAYAATLGSIDHEGGTLAYGDVLKPSGELADAPGIFAAGPSTFPRPGAANPSLTTLALAWHVAGSVASSVAARS